MYFPNLLNAYFFLSLEDKENVRDSKSARQTKLEEKERRPLQSIDPVYALQEDRETNSPDTELELLCAQNDQELLQKSREKSNPLSRMEGRDVYGENNDQDDAESEFERQMEQLMIDRDQAPPPPTVQALDPPKATVEEMSVVHKANLSYLRNQENQPQEFSKVSTFNFTPSSVESGIHWPVVGQK